MLEVLYFLHLPLPETRLERLPLPLFNLVNGIH